MGRHAMTFIQREPQSPAVAFDDRAADGEANAERAGLRRMKRVEHTILVLFHNSSARIANAIASVSPRSRRTARTAARHGRTKPLAVPHFRARPRFSCGVARQD